MDREDLVFVGMVLQSASDNFPMLAEQPDVQKALEIVNIYLNGENEVNEQDAIEVPADGEATEEPAA